MLNYLSNMRAAAIDIGSNTIRLLVADIRKGVLSRIHTERAVTRLAGGIRDSGRLGEESMRRSVAVLKTFAGFAREHGAARVKAVGTSALRQAGNSGEFIGRVYRTSGVRVEVISGMREAELTAEGVLMGLGEPGETLIIDIGGGSTEWIVRRAGKSGNSTACGTLPLGVVSLSEGIIRSDPPSGADIRLFEEEVGAVLSPLESDILRLSLSPGVLVGTGGTITTLAALDLGLREYDPGRVHGHRISRTTLQVLRDRLLGLRLAERQSLEGLEPDRADLIIPGILLTIRFMVFFGFPEITVSDYGLLEALIKEMDDEDRF